MERRIFTLVKKKLFPRENACAVICRLLLALLGAWGLISPADTLAATLTIGTSTATSGAGTGTTAYYPMYTCYGYSYTQSIYLASELAAAGATPGTPVFINSISYYVTTNVSFSNEKDWVIYMGNTPNNSFATSASWLSVSGMVKVFDGTAMPATTGWYTVTLTTPFLWDGVSNLAVAVDENTPGYHCTNYFRSTNVSGGSRSILTYDDSYNPDPATPPVTTAGYTNGTFASLSGYPDIQLDYSVAPPCSGTVTAGTSVASASTLCPGTSVILGTAGATASGGLTYVWDTSGTGAGGWAPVSTTSTAAVFSYVPPSGRTLYYRCRVICTATAATATSTTVAVTVSAVRTPPYTEDFETGTAGLNMPCAATTGTWSASTSCSNPAFDLKVSTPCTTSYPSITNHTPGGSKYLFAGYNLGSYNSSLGTAADQQYWYTPGIQLFAGTTYRFSYWYVNSGYGGCSPRFGMYYNTAQSGTGAIAIKPDIADATTAYKQNVGDFSVPADGIYYLAIKINQLTPCYNAYGTAFDDVNLIEMPACSTATAVTLGRGGKAAASPTVVCNTPNTTTLSVSGTPAFAGLNFSWEYATGTPVSFAATGLTSAIASYNISAGGVYYFRCKISCPATGLATYSDTVRVTTTPIPPPYAENFENTASGVNVPCAAVAGTFSAGTTQYWDVKALNPYSASYPGITNHTPGGSKYLFAGYSMGQYAGSVNPGYWMTPALALTAGKAYKFSFWYSSNYNYSYYNYSPVQLGVRVGTAQTLAGMSYPAGADTVVLPCAATAPTYDQLSRSFMIHTTGSYYVGIKNNPLNYDYPGIAMDDITLDELPSCTATPVAGRATANARTVCGGGTDTLYLLGTAWASDLSFQWQSSATGAVGSWSNVSTGAGGNTSVYITSSLTATGPIYYRCIVKCPAASGINFDTSAAVRVDINAIVPPYSEDFETARSGVNMPCAGYSGTWTTGTTSYWDMKVGPFTYLSCGGIKNHTPGGSKYLFAGYYLGSWSTSAQYWFTPALALTASKAYNFSFWFSNTAASLSYATYPVELGVRVGNAQTAAAMTMTAGADTIVLPNASLTPGYNQLQRGFIAPATANYYVGIRVNYQTAGNLYGFAIDDINLTQLPPCSAQPSAGKSMAVPAVICGSGTSMLSLDGVSAASDLNFQWWECDASGSLLTAVAGATAAAFTTATLTTTKYYRCVVTCPLIAAPNTDTSKLIKVNVTPIIPPYSEDFETGTIGVNMPCAAYSGTWSAPNYWFLYDVPNASYPNIRNHTAGGKKYLYAGAYLGNYNSGNVAHYWFTPGMALTGGKSYKFNAWYTGSGYASTSANEPWGQMSFFAGTAQTEAAMTMFLGDTIINGSDATYRTLSRSFTAPATGTYYIGIKVDHMGYVYPGIAIDDISLEQNAACAAKPAAGRAHAMPNMICSSGTSILRAAGTSQASGLTYQWQTAAAISGPWSNATGGSGATAADYTTPTLSVAGEYYYRCVVTCSGSGLSDTTAATRVNVGYITPPYREDFERTAVCVNTPCASSYSAATASSFQTYASYIYYWAIKAGDSYPTYPGCTNHTPGGLKHLVAGYALGAYYSSSYATNYWFTPAIRLVKDSSYEFSYWYALNSYASILPVSTVGMYYGTAQTAAGMTTAIIPDLTGQTNNTFKQLVGRFVAPSTDTYYFGIKVNHTGYVYYGLSIDDINLEQLPPCTGMPTAGVVSISPAMLCAAGTATLTMDMGGVSKASGLRYYWQYTDTDPASGFVVSGTYGSSASPLTSPVYTTGTLSTARWFRCVVKCLNTGDSTFSSTIKIDVGAITPPYIETFESGVPGVNMPCAAYTYSGGASVYTGPSSYFGATNYWNLWARSSTSYGTVPLTNHTPGGSKYLSGGPYIGYPSYSGYAQEYWFTPALALTAGKLYQLSYWYVTDGLNGSTPPNYSIAAYLGTSQTAAAMTTPLGPALTKLNNTTYQQVAYQFTAAATGNYYIGFKKGQTAYGYGLALDDIGVQEVLPCSAPVVAGSVTIKPRHVCALGGTTTLDLTGTTLATGLAYIWQSRTGAGPWTTFTTVAPPVSSPAMLETTWFRCIVICAATGATDTTGEQRATVGGMPLPYTETFETTLPGDAPMCSDATIWGSSINDGWRVWNGTYTAGYINHTPGGSRWLCGGYNLGSPASPGTQNYWFSPGFNLKAGYKYHLSFWYVAASTSNATTNYMGVYYGNAQNAAAMSNMIVPYKICTNPAYAQIDTIFTVSRSGLSYLGFRKSGSSPSTTYSYYGVGFDDINLEYAPCDGLPFPGGITGTVTSGTSLCKGTMVTLVDTGATIPAVPRIKYQWQRRGLGSTPPITWTPVAGAIDTLLKADTLIGYEYRLGVICGNTHDTAFSAAHQLPALSPHPAVSILPSGPIAFCVGDTVRLTATSFSGGVYDWMLDSIAIPGWKFSDMSATEPGDYMVRATSPLSSCPAFSKSVHLDAVDPGFKVDISTPADSFLCDGMAVTLTATGSKPGLSFQWRKDNVDIPGAVSPMYIVTRSGNYRVLARNSSSICPAASRTITFTVKPNPPAVISVPGGTLTACAEVGVLLQANAGAYSYQWYRGGGPVFGWMDSAVIAKDPGVYTVKVRDAGGCLSESVPVTVNILPSPVPVITMSGPSSSPTLATTISTYLHYMWIRNGATTDTAYTPALHATQNGVYRVIVTDINGCTGISAPVVLDDKDLGLGNVQLKSSDIRIYPNPTDGKVFIESPVSIRLEVKDAAGKTIFEQTNATQVDMSKYADGVYLFLVSDQTGKQLLKEQRVNKLTH